ncbi:MAG: outer membrane protein assembly factor BamD [Myxococcales bacterium]|nr:outer membrane protein assembly factor BamD [Myxococcales bacterium]
MRLRRFVLWVLLATVSAGGSGCAFLKDLFGSEPDHNPQAYFERANDEFDDEDYDDAVEYYEQVITLFPYSKYATAAELRIGESYFLDEAYPEALLHLNEFEKRHPRHKDIEYVLYLLAMSYAKQIPTIDRTPNFAAETVKAFDRLLERFPDGQYTAKATAEREKAAKWLAEYTMQIAIFYYRAQDYWATWGRCMEVLDEHRGLGQDDRALYYLGKAYFFLGEDAKAEQVFLDHESHFPNSPRHPSVETFLATIRDEGLGMNRTWRKFKERVFYYFGYE